MKLSPTTHATGAERHTEKKTTGKTTGGFQQVLETAIDRKAAPNGAPSCRPSASVPSILGLDALRSEQPACGVQRMAHFIDVLDAYQQRLADPQCSLRDVAAAFQRLEDEHGRLSQMAQGASLDRDLRAVVNEALTTATLEIHRFRSGLYC